MMRENQKGLNGLIQEGMNQMYKRNYEETPPPGHGGYPLGTHRTDFSQSLGNSRCV